MQDLHGHLSCLSPAIESLDVHVVQLQCLRAVLFSVPRLCAEQQKKQVSTLVSHFVMPVYNYESDWPLILCPLVGHITYM